MQAIIIVPVVVMIAVIGGFLLIGSGDAENDTTVVAENSITEKSAYPIFPKTEELYSPGGEGEEKGTTQLFIPGQDNAYKEEVTILYNDFELGIGTQPSMVDIIEEDGTKETNEAFVEREKERYVNPDDQALRQPVEETIIQTETKEEEAITKSKYIGKISFRGSGARNTYEREMVELFAYSSNESSIKITGWKLRSAVSGKVAEIGKAEKLYISGYANKKESVILEPGGKVYLITGHSPIGFSFQINKCLGYIRPFHSFYPSFSTTCPDPEEEVLFYKKDPSIFIDNVCMDYIERIPRCTVPKHPLPNNLTIQCQTAIIENLGYNKCVSRHRSEEDFYLLDQRVYLGYGGELWRNKREIVELIDEDGFVIDFVKY
jgi:hypothetical protein